MAKAYLNDAELNEKVARAQLWTALEELVAEIINLIKAERRRRRI